MLLSSYSRAYSCRWKLFSSELLLSFFIQIIKYLKIVKAIVGVCWDELEIANAVYLAKPRLSSARQGSSLG